MTYQSETCPDCEVGQLQLEAYSDEIEYREHTIRPDGLQCLVCDNCGAEIFRPEQIRHNDRLIAEAKRRADGLLLADEIRSIRKSFGLTQHQAAEIFGGGANAFSKYERGEVIQSVPMDRLLRLLARYPILLVEMALEAGVRVRSIEEAGTYSIEQRLSLNDPDFRGTRHAQTIAELGSDEWSKTA
ncbi:MAG: type II toxin-antitoxin system MqsA family antitoxin [Xanthomonadales bacterium]|nr:type II toxin-antitoxin system MqsA family antitoxin [Xanthomonadales bacterium]